ncbi:signal peptidase I [Georgenia yuyongxinii]|uniref:Signal peptidase I n=1 Tax=Georgenia yuyongxinii TaxID=2589797 RepID=A0A552WK08_9MICO|nr:signal peptidase I [Georgenia yuyongxinii]
MAAAAAVVLLALLVRQFVITWYPVVSDSMAPTVSTGSHVVVDKLGWRLGGLQHGDVVVLTSPADGTLLVKRVVGRAGDEVRIDDAILVVNDRPLEEPYVDHSRIDATYFGPVTVPADHVFVMGDNRFGSIDSRVFGPVPLPDVVGRVITDLG